MAPQLARIAELTEPRHLARLFGPVQGVTRATLATPGFSGATHERLTVTLRDGRTRALVLKTIDLSRDFTAVRTLDRVGREARFAAARRSAVWRMLRSPYLDWASERPRVAVLMEDLTDHLLPDVRRPLERWQEDTVLAALARLHARYWQHPGLGAPWLARAEHLEGMLIESDDGRPPLGGSVLSDRVRQGWAALRDRVSPAFMGRLHCGAQALRAEHASLPRTLVHGDAKVANFAVARGEVWAFDWACASAAPPSHELGWYLAVNASRLTRPKEAVMERYRVLLEEQLGAPLAEAAWSPLARHAVRAGARTLLWSKTLALEAGGQAARAEWDWWVTAFEQASRA
jgi:hypothetical protein